MIGYFLFILSGLVKLRGNFSLNARRVLKKLMKYALYDAALNDPVPELTPFVDVLTHFWIPTMLESGFCEVPYAAV